MKERIVGREKNRRGERGGGGGVNIVILSPSTSTQIPNHKASEKKKKQTKKHISKQDSKQAIRPGKLGKITKCLLTRFS